MNRWFIAVMACVFLAASAVASQSACAAPIVLQETARYVSSPYPGLVNQITVDPYYIYASLDDGGFEIRDKSTGEQLDIIRVVPDAYAVQFVLRGNLAYVADWCNGLSIIDISDKENLAVVASWRAWDHTLAESFAVGVALKGNYAFLSIPAYGLVSLDISNPAAPVQVGFVPNPASNDRFSLVWPTNDPDRLLVESYRNALVYDTTDPASLVQRVSIPAYPLTRMGYDPVDNLMFVGFGWSNSNILKIYDFTNPDNPVYISTYAETLPAGQRHTVTFIRRVGDYLFVGDANREVMVLDCSDLYNLHEVAYFPLPSGVTQFMGGNAFDGNNAYFGTCLSGIIKVDLSPLGGPFVPEPATVLLLAGGILGVIAVRRPWRGK
jgi:hypothetical protein